MNKLDSELVASQAARGRLRAAARRGFGRPRRAAQHLFGAPARRGPGLESLGRLRHPQAQRSPSSSSACSAAWHEEHRRYMHARMPHVDLVVGPSAFGDIDRNSSRSDRARKAARSRRKLATRAGVVHVEAGVVSGDVDSLATCGVRPHRSQAYVSIMRGCNMPCTYCIVPATRGAEISRPMDEIFDEASQRLADDGVTEITLLGQTVNAYGRDLGSGRDPGAAAAPAARDPGSAAARVHHLAPQLLVAGADGAMAELPKVSATCTCRRSRAATACSRRCGAATPSSAT